MASNGKSKSNENIQVYVRCRPINAREKSIHSNEMVKVQSNREVIVQQMFDSKTVKKFTFDRAFGPTSKQCEVYDTVVAPLITEVLAGYNCTVFAYGQTGTGKTHTMIGDDSTYKDVDNMGIVPRAVKHLFEELRLMKVEFAMRISYLELYNEELSDLLSLNDASQVRIFDDSRKKGSVIVQGLEEIPVRSTADVFKQLEKGQEKRKMASTLMNAQSSRSHTIFSISVHITEKRSDGEELVKVGKINLVDLAGSENITKAGNEKGIRTRETVSINQSLLTLGRVITALVERTPHVPYRESKLTRLLQESLGGRTKTSIIATISPGHKDLEETLSTLEYAHRAKNIQNKPEINQKIDKKVALKEYSEEIEKLKRDLVAARDKNGIFLAEETYNELKFEVESKNKELNEQILLLRTQKDDLQKYQDMLSRVNTDLAERTKELEEKENILSKTKNVLEQAKRGYVEKKQLMLKHKETETVLKSQAQELINVANIVTDDVQKLHASIAKRKEFEKKNQTAIENLEDFLKNHFQNIKANLTTFGSEYDRQISINNDQLQSNAKQTKTMLTAASTNLGNLLEIEQQSKNDIDECITQHKKKFYESFKNQIDKSETIVNETISINDKFTSEIERIDEQLRDKFNEFRVEHEGISKLTEETSTAVVGFCDSISTKMQKSNDETCASFRDARQIMEETTSANDKVLDAMFDVLNQMQNMVKTMKSNNKDVENFIPILKEKETKFESETKENLKQINDYKNQMAEMKNSKMEKLSICGSVVRTIDSNVLKSKEMNREKDAKIIANIKTAHEHCKEQTEVVSNQLDSMFSDIGHINDLADIDISGGLNDLISECETAKARIDDDISNFYEMNCNIESLQKEFQHDLAKDVDTCEERLETFRASDINVYKPSGETPAKNTYTYPRKLMSTSPHPKILDEFWRNHDGSPLECSAIVNEEDETVQEESETTANEFSTMNDGNSTVMNDTHDRTLTEIFNKNAISTPLVENDQKKGFSRMQMSLNNNISQIKSDNKEN